MAFYPKFLYNLQALFNPDMFQGKGKIKRYFEGWYFKVVNAAKTEAYAIIPGIAMDQEGLKQAFIQILDGKRQTAVYHKFDFNSFISSDTEFRISIGNNSFTKDNLELDLPEFAGRLEFSSLVPWPKPWYSPGIMGPYSFVPFMECYHGIVSLNHSVKGKLHVNSRELDFNQGLGYTEKDWGRSFPCAYVWMQSNHFSLPGISVKASVARIPWIRDVFTGFIAGVWVLGRLIQFTTYNGTVLRKLQIDRLRVELILVNRKHQLTIIASREAATSLASPIMGFMDGRIEESMTSRLEVFLTDQITGQVILHDTGYHAGLEVAGEIGSILKDSAD